MWDFLEEQKPEMSRVLQMIFQLDCKALFLVFANLANVVLYG